MSGDKKATLFFHSWRSTLRKLSLEQVGRLTMALLDLDSEGIVPNFSDDPLLDIGSTEIIETVIREGDKYDQKIERYKAAAKKREEEKKQNSAQSSKNHQSFDGTGTVTDTETVTVTDTVTDTVIVTDTDTVTGSGSVTDTGSTQPHHLPELDAAAIDLIIRHWNDRTITRPIQKFGPVSARANNVRLCINGDFGQFIDTIKHLDEQQFLMKQFMDKGRQITFDWFVRPENYQKVVEGNYAEAWKEAENDGYAVDW